MQQYAGPAKDSGRNYRSLLPNRSKGGYQWYNKQQGCSTSLLHMGFYLLAIRTAWHYEMMKLHSRWQKKFPPSLKIFTIPRITYRFIYFCNTGWCAYKLSSESRIYILAILFHCVRFHGVKLLSFKYSTCRYDF